MPLKLQVLSWNSLRPDLSFKPLDEAARAAMERLADAQVNLLGPLIL
ncbi:MAG: hypothetical protein AAF754_17755 [Pseudomonadota bacterium]